MRKKIAVVVSHPIQYHAVIWREMAKVTDWDVEVLFCSDHGQKESFDKEFNRSFKWDISLTDGYKHTFYKNSFLARKKGFFKYVNFSLLIRLFFFNYKYVYFHGYGNFTNFFGIILSKMSGKKVIVKNIAYNIDDISGLKKVIKKIIYIPYLKLCDYFLYIGTHNYNYFKDYKVEDKKLIFTPHVVDNLYFNHQKNILQNENTNNLYSSWGFSQNDKIILFCAKLIPKKQPKLLIEAFLKAEISNIWKLLIVGDGEEKQELEELALNSNKLVTFKGFLNQSEIAKAYFLADLIVLPSRFGETWGLVVNEALLFDCAVIVSNKVGCAPDLVNGKTGLVFDYNNKEALIKAIETIANNNEILEKFKYNASKVIDLYKVDKIIEQLITIIK